MMFGEKRKAKKEQELREKEEKQKQAEQKKKKQLKILGGIFAGLMVSCAIGALTEKKPATVPDTPTSTSAASVVEITAPTQTPTTTVEPTEAPNETAKPTGSPNAYP